MRDNRIKPNHKGVCLLCGKTDVLLSKSHIISKFIYKPLKDEAGRMVYTPLSDYSKREFHQTGFFDKYILCEKCDNVLLSGFERYVANLLFEGILPHGAILKFDDTDKRIKILRYNGIDILKIKLFALSLLWRSHVSHNVFFKQVKLTEIVENRLKEMILNSDSGNIDEFRIVIVRLDDPSDIRISLISDPIANMLNGDSIGSFIINGYIFIIELSPNSNFGLFQDFSIKENGELLIPILKGNIGYKYLTGFGIPNYEAGYFMFGRK